jgi:hypothetical protein
LVPCAKTGALPSSAIQITKGRKAVTTIFLI